MISPTLKLLSFDLTLTRKHSAGTSNVSGSPSREVKEKIGKSLMAGKPGWQQREVGWMRTQDFIWCCRRKEQEWWEAATKSLKRGSKAEHNLEIRSKITLQRLLEVGPIHFLTYIKLFPSNSPLLCLDKMLHIPGPPIMWFSILVLKIGRMWSNSHCYDWVCAFMLARNIDLCTETQSIHTYICNC